MITLHVSDKKITDQKAHCYGFLLEEGFSLPSDVKEVAAKFSVDIDQYLKKHTFTGKLMETFSMPVILKDSMYHLIFVGLGKKTESHIPVENYRRALAHLYKQIVSSKDTAAAIIAPSAKLFDCTPHMLGQQTAIILPMAAYNFDEFVTEKENKESKIKDIYICVDSKSTKEFDLGAVEGGYIAIAVNKTRHWVDMPPSKLTPSHVVKHAQDIAKKRD
jgi:Leucyl aminopeptidase